MTYYNVFLWSGAGYTLDKIEVMADCEEQALDLAVVQIEKQGKTGLFFDDCEEIEKMEEQGLVLYIDATMEGASAPHYIDAQNLRIEAVKKAETDNIRSL